MSRITKTITKIHVTPEEMAGCREAEINSRIETFAAQMQERADALLVWAKNSNVQNTWTYMANKDVFYIPQLVGVMPNLGDFDVTVQGCSNSLVKYPTDEQMKFADFEGDFPTESEAKRCFDSTDIYCRQGKYIRVKNNDYDGVSVRSGNTLVCYNLYRGGKTENYGAGSSSDKGANIPIHRFNGKNSSAVSLAQTILYWLTYNLRPAALKGSNDIIAAFNFLAACHKYLIAEGDALRLDVAKVLEAIYAGTELKWLPEGTADILSAKVITASEEVKERFKTDLLHADERVFALEPYDEKLLTDPNRGHWDLWGLDEDAGEDGLWLDLGEGLTARNPAADVSDGIVAIDFGTKSTVVVYEGGDQKIESLQVGSGTQSKGLQAKDYENPTVLQFISFDGFMDAYTAKAGRPATRWDDLTVSHNAFQNLKDASSDKHNTFFDGLKQWCGTSGQWLKLQDEQGKIWELPPFMELDENDMDPLEIYAYYLGRYINHMRRGKIFLHYIMSFPVTYEHRIRERMGNSIRKGLRKSFPMALLADEVRMKDFWVREIASEPAAYAITALDEYGFAPKGDEQSYYAVFDFGGGTTDFDFGMYQEEKDIDSRYDYILTHFGENGDRTLGGENLLRLLAFEVFRANRDYLLHPDGEESVVSTGAYIPFTMAPDAEIFAGHESLIRNSREAQQNMRNLMEKLRPVWEAPDSEEAKQISSSGQIQLTLYRGNGEKKTDASLKLKIGDTEVKLQEILKNRIEQGIKRFFTALAEAFDKSAGGDSRIAPLSDVREISVFLAGNSSRSPLVSKLFQDYLKSVEPSDTKEALQENGIDATVAHVQAIAKKLSSLSAEEGFMTGNVEINSVPADGDGKERCTARTLLQFGDEQAMPKFVIFPPLGTQEADERRKERGAAADGKRDPIMRPTGKSGVAYGLLKCREGGVIKVETITPDGARVPFQYYIGRRKKGKFRLIIDRNAKMKTWYKFIDAGGAFDILYTDRPEAATGDAPMTIAKQKHISIENPDQNAFVYIRPVESRVIEYMIARDESELAAGGVDKCDPVRIELE